MKSTQIALSLFSLVLFFSGCLKTRNEVKDTEQKQVMQQQMVYLQKNTADAGNRFSDLEEQMRYLSGRVETLENKVSRSDSDEDRRQKAQAESLQDINKKMQIYQEALTKMEAQIIQLQNEIAKNESARSEGAKSKAENNSRESSEGSAKSKNASKTSYDVGQELFNQKDWKAAIIEYQKYRDQFPKGKSFADATYKIGVCFQELNMKEDAKSFYQEVVSRFPNSDEARRAKTRLKSMK